MYRDISQWRAVRRRILIQGVSKKQVARETGVSRKTINKILRYEHPPGYKPRPARYPQLWPYLCAIDRLLDDAISSSTLFEPTISSIVRQLRRDEGFAGSYDSVRNYILRGSREDDSALEYAYDLITRLPKSRALDLLRLLRCKVPMPSPRLQPFVREVGAFEDRLHENTESASASSTSSGCGKCFRRI